MVEMTFGSGSPMWTTMPSVGLPYQSMGLGGFPVSTPAFASPFLPGGGGSISAQGASAPGGLSTAAYGYNGSAPGAQPNLTGTGFAATHPFASNPWASQFAGEAGVVTASSLLALVAGSVQHKRTKHDIGEIAWAIPVLHDVQNNVSITSRRRGRAASRETETPANVSARKQG